MNNLLLVIVSAITFVGMMAAGSFVYWGIKSREEEQARELARRLGTLSEKPEDRLFRIQVQDQAAEALGNIGKQLDDLIRQSGEDVTVSDLLFRMGLVATISVVILAVWLKTAVALGGVMLGSIPLLLLSSKASDRAKRLSEQLPDALDLVGRSLQAGHGFSDALRMCAEEMPFPIAHEFGRVYEEHNLGRDFRECLVSLTERNPGNFDLKIFVSAVLLQRETGGNLIEILDNISKTVRDRFVFSAKVRALTAEARISAIILGSLPFLISGALVVLQPNYLRPLAEDPLGRMVLAGVIVLFATGTFVMYQMSKVEI